MPDSNPLLLPYDRPPFSAIQAHHLLPAIQQIITECRGATASIISSQAAFPTWDDLVLAVDELEARLEGFVHVLTLLDSVPQGWAWQQASTRSQAMATQYKAELAGNSDLYRLHRQLAASPIAALFSEQRQGALQKKLRKYRVAGLELSPEKQLQLSALNQDIDVFSQAFLDRVKNANDAWRKHILDASLLS